MRETFEDTYREFKNYLGKVLISESLGVVRAFSQKNNFDASLPSDLRGVPPQFITGTTLHGQVLDWHLEVLAREMLLHSQIIGISRKDFREWNHFAKAINKINKLDNIAVQEDGDDYDIKFGLMKLAHRQFNWQSRPNTSFLYRYYRLFNHVEVEPIFSKQLGVTPRIAMLIGMSLTGHYIDKYGLYYPPILDFSKKIGITQDAFKNFTSSMYKPIIELRTLLKEDPNRVMGTDFFHYDHSLRKYPIVLTELDGQDALVCPLPTLLYWRFTDGFYYDLINIPSFDNAFGNSYEEYVGDVTKKVLGSKGSKFQILAKESESVATAGSKNAIASSDWFVTKDKCTLFVECKVKRMPLISRLGSKASDKFDSEMDKLAESVFQIYRCIDAFKSNKYKSPSYKFNSTQKIYPLLVTLQSWHLFGPISEVLEQKVLEKLRDASLENLFHDYPFTICSIEEYEILLYAFEKDSICKVMSKKADRQQQYFGWGVYSYLNDKYKDIVRSGKYAFDDEFDHDFPESMKDTKDD